LKFYGFDAGVGVFVIATQLASPAAMPMGALADAEIARVGEIFKERKLEGVRSDLPHAMKRYGLASVLPAVALVMAIPLFSLILGARTRGALSLVPWLALIALVDAPYYPLSTVLYYASRLRAVSFVTAVSCFATLGAMTVLVPQFGVAGALVARAIAAFIRLATIAAIAVGVLRDVRRERSLPF
jgi:O-antigen/teichoic acid export membrane protein